MMDLIDREKLLQRFKDSQRSDPKAADRGFSDNFFNASMEPSAEWWCIEDMVESQPKVDAVPICWLENLRDRIMIEAMGKCKDGESVDVTDARCVNRTLELIREGMKNAD